MNYRDHGIGKSGMKNPTSSCMCNEFTEKNFVHVLSSLLKSAPVEGELHFVKWPKKSWGGGMA